ncbi:hypothetical protein HK100_011542 [Physocladia obscura]|uniref:Fe2OG dioxygenase domain-containing protein n=1 Tax=Physocladia obscura TaxID=109957 RepID=A0AAD5T196_9FUNG|nr:hypothetical protein HK100_011542 [Physocladia obscura]
MCATQLEDLFGEISDDESNVTDNEHHVNNSRSKLEVYEHSQIAGLWCCDIAVPPAQQALLEPQLRRFFVPNLGQNQAMRFGQELLPPSHECRALLETATAMLANLSSEVLQHRDPAFDQLIANHYGPSEGIVAHTDLPRFEDGIVIFSFLSTRIMRFVMISQPHTQIDVVLRPGSCVCLSGDARYKWTHALEISDDLEELIFDKNTNEWTQFPKEERISITLRKMKPNQIFDMKENVYCEYRFTIPDTL